MSGIKKGPSGNPRLNPNGSISSGCCCKCYVDTPDCTVEECTATYAESGCCYKCGDTASVTLGDILASGTGDFAPAAAMLETASGSSVSLKFIGPGGSGLWPSFQYWSKPKPNPDGEDGYRYGFGVRISQFNALGPSSAAYWGVYATLYRVTEAAYVQGGPCEDIETQDVIQPATGYPDTDLAYPGLPELSKKSSCCTGADLPVQIVGTALTSVSPVSTITINSTCDSVCSCGALADEVTVETGDISRLLPRVGQAECDTTPDECQCYWKMDEPGPPEACPAKTYGIEIQRRGCEWRLDITETTWEEVLVEGVPICMPVDIKSGFWLKSSGADVLGTYTHLEGTVGGETAVVE